MKDRLDELTTLYEKHHGAESEDPLPHQNDPEESYFHNQFLEKVGEAKIQLERIKSRVNIIAAFHMHMEQSSSDSVRKEISGKINSEVDLILKGFKEVQKLIEELDSINPSTSIFKQIKEVQLEGLINDVGDTINKYTNTLEAHREKSIKQIENILFITQGHREEDVSDLLEKGAISFFTNNILLETEEMKLRLRDVEDRRDELIKLENNIREVRDLFVRMAFLTKEQNKTINHLADSADYSENKVTAAQVKLRKAAYYQKSNRAFKLKICFCCSIFLIVLLLLITLLSII